MVEMTPERARRINTNMPAIIAAKMSRKLIRCARGTWTHGELHEAFRHVQDRDWKNPISAWVGEADVDLVLDAIDFFAGGDGRVVRRERNRAHVSAPGYYIAVGA